MPVPPRAYATPGAFKHALEDRLRAEARRNGLNPGRLRQLLIFDRLLGRLSLEFGDAVVTKGGVALELRLARARTTRDVDVRLAGTSTHVLERLQAAGRRELGDFLTFLVREQAEEPLIEGEGIIYEGRRFRAEAQLGGQRYGDPFGLDVAFGDVLTGEVEVMEGSHLLGFIGVARSRIRLYPRETHLAEKLHAYTLPRERENTRVKDLPDMALLGLAGPLDAGLLRVALQRTFGFRRTHALPKTVPAPPASWAVPYARMARDNELPWKSLEEVTGADSTFLGTVLAGGEGIWAPDTWDWRSPTP